MAENYGLLVTHDEFNKAMVYINRKGKACQICLLISFVDIKLLPFNVQYNTE